MRIHGESAHVGAVHRGRHWVGVVAGNALGEHLGGCSLLFFFNDAPTTGIYTLSLHDALPIWPMRSAVSASTGSPVSSIFIAWPRSEEHTSELQSRRDLVCRLLLEKKKWILLMFWTLAPCPSGCASTVNLPTLAQCIADGTGSV